MDGFVMHMFYNEFIIYIFQLTPMLLVLRISSMYMARNYNITLLHFFFVFVYKYPNILVHHLTLFYGCKFIHLDPGCY